MDTADYNQSQQRNRLLIITERHELGIVLVIVAQENEVNNAQKVGQQFRHSVRVDHRGR